MSHQMADVCLLVEGAYPYVKGGVSSWIHQLIQEQSHLNFHIVSLVSKQPKTKPVYTPPRNLVGLSHTLLQAPPTGQRFYPRQKKLLKELSQLVPEFLEKGNLNQLAQLLHVLGPHRSSVGSRQLLNSPATWEMVLEIYENTLPDTSFLNFFWSFRSILSGLYATLLTPLPRAKAYHAISTGYAGLLLARARLETGGSALITEHGIYTNERRIELVMADWLFEGSEHRYEIDADKKTLVDVWMQSFESYALSCYQACDKITTLYSGNRTLQIQDGAPPQKTEIIPNGVNIEPFARIPRIPRSQRQPTVALIGRCVSIKDIKTYIRAVALLVKRIPTLQAWLLGPIDEEPDYYQECASLVKHAGLERHFEFKGTVKLTEYLGKIDCIVLTSVSEAQPLVILEAGASGVPVVATDVGSCREILEGTAFPGDNLGPGGLVTSVASPGETAEAIAALLNDPEKRDQYGQTLRQRVIKYYNAQDISRRYSELYEQAIDHTDHNDGSMQWLA